MRNTTFNTKEEYLAYRAQWKATYKELSAAIRNEKAYAKDCQRNPVTGYDSKTKTWTHYRPWTDKEQERRDRYSADAGKFKSLFNIGYLPKHSLSGLATQMLAELKESKVEAQRQYLASKANLATA